MANLTQRAREFTLASVLTTYPSAETRELLEGLAGPACAGALHALLQGAGGLEDAQSAYCELFDRGGQRASLYESEYGRMRGMSKGNTLADIGGFYQAFGLTIDQERAHELVDHIAVELEFYSTLLLKQELLLRGGDEEGVFVVSDARGKFLREHLGSLAQAIAERAEVRAEPSYGPIFTWCAELVAGECRELEVTPTPLDFFADESEKGEMKCGAVHLPVVS